MVHVVVWRMVHPRFRNGVLIGTTLFGIERVVAFGLRAHVAHSASARASEGLETYFQTTYSGGFTSIGDDLMNLLRALLVSSTLGGEMVALHELTPPHVRKAQACGKADKVEMQLVTVVRGANDGASVVSGAALVGSGPEELVDQPELRKKIWRWCRLATLLNLSGVIMSIIAGSNYKRAIDGIHGELVRSLWYASTVLGVVLLVGMAVTAVFALSTMPRVPRASLQWIILIAVLLATVGVYRITVLTHSTTSLSLTGPGTQNTPGAKAAFYVFHVAPEFLSAAALMSLNVRRVFGTGPWGDGLWKDPKPKPKPDPDTQTQAQAQAEVAAKTKRG